MATRPVPVGFVLIAESGGGAATAIERLLGLLDASGIEAHLLGNDLPWIRSAQKHNRPRLVLPDAVPGSLNSGLKALRGAWALVQSLLAVRRYARKHPALVLLPFLTGTSLVTLAATLGLPNPVIVCERNDASKQRHGWHVELLKRALYPRASAITVNVPVRAAHLHLARISRGRPVHFVLNPRPKDVPPADVATSRIVLSVGRLVPQKQHATLLAAFAQARQRTPGWSLRIAGDGPLREHLYELVEELGLGDTSELLGHVDDPGSLYAEAGLFVLASDFEGTSNALLEAASAGLPCIVSSEASPTAVEGVFTKVPAGSVEELCAALVDLCSDSARRQQLGESAREWVSSTTDQEVLAAWESVLRSVGRG